MKTVVTEVEVTPTRAPPPRVRSRVAATVLVAPTPTVDSVAEPLFEGGQLQSVFVTRVDGAIYFAPAFARAAWVTSFWAADSI